MGWKRAIDGPAREFPRRPAFLPEGDPNGDNSDGRLIVGDFAKNAIL